MHLHRLVLSDLRQRCSPGVHVFHVLLTDDCSDNQMQNNGGFPQGCAFASLCKTRHKAREQKNMRATIEPENIKQKKKEDDEAESLELCRLHERIRVSLEHWAREAPGQTVLSTITVLTGSTGVGGRMHWRVLRVMSSCSPSASLLIMESSSR